VFCLLGCSVPGTPGPGEKRFSGPWAAEFQEAYGKAKDEAIREILADGEISELEFSEVWTKYTSCLAASGVRITNVEFDGSTESEFDPGVTPDAAREAETRCSESSGEYPVGMLYHWVRGNPMNEDESVIISACLVDRGLAPKGYGAREYEQDLPDYPSFVNTPEDVKIYESCRIDPLGLQARSAG